MLRKERPITAHVYYYRPWVKKSGMYCCYCFGSNSRFKHFKHDLDGMNKSTDWETLTSLTLHQLLKPVDKIEHTWARSLCNLSKVKLVTSYTVQTQESEVRVNFQSHTMWATPLTSKGGNSKRDLGAYTLVDFFISSEICSLVCLCTSMYRQV